MPKKDRVSSAVFLVLGLSVAYFSTEIGVGNVRLPGPGFLPFCGGVLLSSVSCSIFILSLARGAKSQKAQVAKPPHLDIRLGRIISILAGLAIYTFLLENIGFLLSSFLLLIFLFKGIEPQKTWIALFASFVTVFLSYLIFFLWLGIQFPKGPLGI